MHLKNSVVGAIVARIKVLTRSADALEVIRAASWTATFKVVGLCISFFSSTIMATLYGASAIGILVVAFTVVNIAILIVKFGTDLSVVRLVATSRAVGGAKAVGAVYWKVISMVAPLSVAAAVVVMVSSPYIAEHVFRKPHVAEAIAVMALGLPFTALTGVHLSALRGIKKIEVWSLMQTVVVPALMLTALLGITFLVLRDEMTPVYAAVAAAVAGGGISAALWFRHLSNLAREPEVPKVKATLRGEALRPQRVETANHPTRRAIILLSLPMFMTSAMQQILNTGDNFFLGIFASTTELGVYNIVFKLSAITGIMLFGVNSIILPKFAEMHALNDEEGLRRLVQFAAKLAFWLTLPVLAPLVLFPGQLLGLFGEEFTTGSQALIVLCLSQLFNAACGSTGPMLNMTGHQKVMQYIMLTVAVLNLVLNFFLVQAYGIMGAAVASAASVICLNAATSVAIYRLFGYWIFSFAPSKPSFLHG